MAHFEYDAPDGSILKADVSAWGQHDIQVELRTLKQKITVQELLAIAYPHFDQQEKASTK